MNKLALLRFDLRHGMPTAIGVLRRELGWLATTSVLIQFLVAGLRDPFRELTGPPPGPRERFTRHQLRPVLLLDQVLRRRFDAARVRDILGAVIAQSGARFVRHNVEHPDPERWRAMTGAEQSAFAQRILSRFGNAETTLVSVPPHDFAFNVSLCHFVGLTQRLGRPDLAPLFCAADSAFYGDPNVPIQLVRERTLAAGDDQCTFRFRFDAE